MLTQSLLELTLWVTTPSLVQTSGFPDWATKTVSTLGYDSVPSKLAPYVIGFRLDIFLVPKPPLIMDWVHLDPDNLVSK